MLSSNRSLFKKNQGWPRPRSTKNLNKRNFIHCCCSVPQSCLTLCDPMDCSMPGFPVHHQLPEPAQTHVHHIGDAIQPSYPLSSLLLPSSIFPSIREFSHELVLHIRCPKYWSFGFSISPSNEYSGLISFRMDWLDLLAPTDLGSSSFSVLSFCLLSCSWGSQGKNTEVVCHFLLQWTTFCQNSIP